MKSIRKFVTRLFLILGLGLGMLILTVLNPTVLYAHETQIDQVTVHHSVPLPNGFHEVLKQTLQIVHQAALYDADFAVHLALDDGSLYPQIMRGLRGPAFGYGYANIALLGCEINASENKAIINGRTWKLDELIAHELIHTYQYRKYNFKTLSIDTWKIEGYAEYSSRINRRQEITKDLQLLQNFKSDHPDATWGWIDYQDGTGVPVDYLQKHLLVRYALEIKKMTYDQLISDTTSENAVYQELIRWAESG